MKELYDELAKTYEPKSEDKSDITNKLKELSSSSSDLKTKL